MSEAFIKEDRRDQLMHVVQVRYAKAQSQADFTAVSLAYEGGVSRAWFYELVGTQFKKLRETLPGPIPSRDSLVVKLRKEVARLRNKLRELKHQYEVSIKEKLAEAIHHIELLDKENRMLRERVANLEKRLSDSKIVISPHIKNAKSIPAKDPN